MPCRDPREYDEPERVAKELNERTDMLCRLMKVLDGGPRWLLAAIPKDVREWWQKHKQFDKSQGR